MQDGLSISFSEKQELHAVSQVAIGAMQRGWRQMSAKMQIKETMIIEMDATGEISFFCLWRNIECLQIKQNKYLWKLTINTKNTHIFY